MSGYAALRQGGASQEAKPKLSRALKLAHSQCCNHQLVAQSLSLIGTVVLDTRGGDLGQSLDMLQSSFTLSKAQEDMPAQLGCLGGLLRLHRLRGSPEEEQSALTSYRRRKLGAYEALRAAAADDGAARPARRGRARARRGRRRDGRGRRDVTRARGTGRRRRRKPAPPGRT